MTSTVVIALAVALCVLLGIVALVGLMVWQARRNGTAQATVTALSQAEAQTIKNFRASEAIHNAVNVDPDLVARARRVMHHAPPK